MQPNSSAPSGRGRGTSPRAPDAWRAPRAVAVFGRGSARNHAMEFRSRGGGGVGLVLLRNASSSPLAACLSPVDGPRTAEGLFDPQRRNHDSREAHALGRSLHKLPPVRPKVKNSIRRSKKLEGCPIGHGIGRGRVGGAKRRLEPQQFVASRRLLRTTSQPEPHLHQQLVGDRPLSSRLPSYFQSEGTLRIRGTSRGTRDEADLSNPNKVEQ